MVQSRDRKGPKCDTLTVANPKYPKPGKRAVNYRLDEDIIAYIEKWRRATGKDKEDVVNDIIRAYRDAVGEPPEPRQLPPMKKAPPKSQK
jgi:uncharacterized protein (DUF4415 family)